MPLPLESPEWSRIASKFFKNSLKPSSDFFRRKELLVKLPLHHRSKALESWPSTLSTSLDTEVAMMPSRPVLEKELALTTEEVTPSPELMSSTISDFQTHTDTHRLPMYTVMN